MKSRRTMGAAFRCTQPYETLNQTKDNSASGLMRRCRLGLLATMIPLWTICCLAGGKDHPKSTAAFPETLTHTLQAGQRFASPAYFRFMAGDGLHSVDPRVLYARMQAAAQANEQYKAFYFATIFTELRPTLAAGWSNRAVLAATFGLTTEAKFCQKNAADPQHAQPVNSSMLPGAAVKYKPVSLSDWAAAVALLANSVAEGEGPEALIAFRDDISGIHEATQQEIADSNAFTQSAGMPPTGPWASAEPVCLQDVLANAFSLRSGQPMKYRFESRSGAFGAALLAGLSGVAAQSNPALAQAGLETAEDENDRASQIPSHYSGGSYVTAIYRHNSQVLDTQKPRAAGVDHAIGSPMPLLLASGGSFAPVYVGHWAAGEKPLMKRITVSDLKSGKEVKFQERRPPDTLYFPKLITLCAARCTLPVTLAELILTSDDVLALAPSLYIDHLTASTGESTIPSVSSYFQSGQIRLEGSFGGTQYVAFDDQGNTYILRWGPAEWVVPIGRK